MGFPGLGLPNAIAKLEQAFAENGTPMDVVLRGQGGSFQIKGTMSKLTPDDLTEGLTQQGTKVRLLATDWDVAAGREPEKGDQLTIWTRRYAVQTWYRRGIGSSLLMYVMVLKG